MPLHFHFHFHPSGVVVEVVVVLFQWGCVSHWEEGECKAETAVAVAVAVVEVEEEESKERDKSESYKWERGQEEKLWRWSNVFCVKWSDGSFVGVGELGFWIVCTDKDKCTHALCSMLYALLRIWGFAVYLWVALLLLAPPSNLCLWGRTDFGLACYVAPPILSFARAKPPHFYHPT